MKESVKMTSIYLVRLDEIDEKIRSELTPIGMAGKNAIEDVDYEFEMLSVFDIKEERKGNNQ